MATTTNFSDWTKMFSEFKTPGVDMNSMISQVRRNAETGSTVIQIMTESAQAIARRQAEVLRSNAEQAIKASKDLLTTSAPEGKASKQADFAKSWLNYNVNSLREIAEMSTKSLQEAFDVLNKRATEQLREFSDTASATVSAAKKKAA